MFRYHVFMTLDWWIFKKFSQPAVNNFLNGTFQSNYALLERDFGSSVGEDKKLGLWSSV